MDIKKLENQLQNLLEREKRQWTKTAQLLIDIERSRLYRKQAKSFSQYVRQLAQKFKINESSFWRIKRAGEYYLKLHNTDNIEIIGKANTSPEQLEILMKISSIAPPNIVQDFKERLISGKTTREELRDTWRTYCKVKKDKPRRGRKSKKQLLDNVIGDLFTNSAAMTTANIIQSLKNPQWAIDTINQKKMDYFQLFTEVAVSSGTSSKPRRIDIVSIVKESNKGPLPTVIGIEVKINIHDLKRDMKLTEYIPFCHYFYLAIPNEQAMIDAAASVTTKEIGILCVTEEVVDGRYKNVIIRKAQRIKKPHPVLLGELYGKCLFHALGWIGDG
jgi:hypothetical protein